MKKICYVVTIPLTIRSFFIPQLRYLSDNGFDVTVICSSDDMLQNELGKKVTFIPVEIPRGISIGGSWKAIRELIRIFRNEKFDIIQYSTPNAALYASIASKYVKCKVRNYHLMGFRYLGANSIEKSLLKEIERFTCKNSTSIECVSKSNLEIGVQEKIFPKNKATVVWNGSTGGVDVERFNYKMREKYRGEIREKYNISEHEFVYGFVGRITRDKGVNEILEAYQQIKGTKLFLIGPNEGIDTLEYNVYRQSLRDNRIIYTDNVKEVEKYFAAIDVLLLPSYREGFGNVVIEAGAMGTPAIVSNIAGPIDTSIKNKTAFWVKTKDAQELKKAMEFCVMHKEIVLKMGLQALDYSITNFSQDILNKKILERKLSF